MYEHAIYNLYSIRSFVFTYLAGNMVSPRPSLELTDGSFKLLLT